MTFHRKSAETLVWALVDVSGGIKTRGTLQDAVFVGQELGLLPSTFSFPIWPGIGTARYSKTLDHAVTNLVRAGRIYDTGGPATLKATLPAPEQARTEVGAARAALRNIDASSLSLMAAYLMAKRREEKDGISGAVALRKGASARLGWPGAVVKQIEERLQAIQV